MDLFTLSKDLINEIQQMRQDLKSGKISPENYSAQIIGIAQIERQQTFILKAAIAQERFKKRFPLLGDIKMIGDIENQKVKCPGLDRMKIERHKCLDFSGEKKFAECEGCLIGIETKNLLLGKK